jgi:hypothetical protein
MRAAFGAIPTPLRLHADPRLTGRGSVIALIDRGFYPHPDQHCRHSEHPQHRHHHAEDNAAAHAGDSADND